MNRLKFLIAITSLCLVTACGNVESSTTALNCLDKSEQEFLDRIQQDFESALKVYYKTEDIDDMYLKFLEGFARMEFPPQFFVNEPTFQIVEQFHSKGYLNQYWASDSEEEEMFLLYTDTESPWFSCLAKDIENEDLNETINSMGEMTELSPGILASAFRESLKKEKMTGEVKKIIALTFYYQQSLILILNMEE